MSNELIFKTLTGLMTQQAAMTKGMEKMESAVDAFRSEIGEVKAASVATEDLLKDLKLIMETFAHNSTDIQKRLAALEEHTGLKPAS